MIPVVILYDQQQKIEALEARKAMLREALEAALNDGTLETWMAVLITY